MDIREATLLKKRHMVSGIADRDMAFDLPVETPLPEALEIVLLIWRVQVQRRPRL